MMPYTNAVFFAKIKKKFFEVILSLIRDSPMNDRELLYKFGENF